MANKYSKERDVKVFYYSLGSHYCAIIGTDRDAISHIREAVLTHFLGECHEGVYHQTRFIEPGKARGLAGQLIHITSNIADKINGEDRYEGVSIRLSPINFEEPKQRKSGLQRLVNLNS
jgi:hypothetical protein